MQLSRTIGDTFSACEMAFGIIARKSDPDDGYAVCNPIVQAESMTRVDTVAVSRTSKRTVPSRSTCSLEQWS